MSAKPRQEMACLTRSQAMTWVSSLTTTTIALQLCALAAAHPRNAYTKTLDSLIACLSAFIPNVPAHGKVAH